MFSSTLDEILKFEPAEISELNTHKASFRYEHTFPSLNDKSIFDGKNIALFISVGQAYHEKGKFLATIDLINKYPFASCTIMMADTLQRHNYCSSLGHEKAFLLSKQAGDAWIKRNSVALKNLKIKYNIVRWDDLLAHKDYHDLKALVVKSYHENQEYKSALHTNVHTYIDRLKLINPDADTEELFNHGLTYLIEECPIVMPLWAKMGYDYIIYPKPLTPGMAKTRELFVSKEFEDKCNWLYLRFKKK